MSTSRAGRASHRRRGLAHSLGIYCQCPEDPVPGRDGKHFRKEVVLVASASTACGEGTPLDPGQNPSVATFWPWGLEQVTQPFWLIHQTFGRLNQNKELGLSGHIMYTPKYQRRTGTQLSCPYHLQARVAIGMLCGTLKHCARGQSWGMVCNARQCAGALDVCQNQVRE